MIIIIKTTKINKKQKQNKKQNKTKNKTNKDEKRI